MVYYKAIVLFVLGGKCTWDGCDQTENLHIHHIDGDRENNAVENLRLLCRKHHRQIHVLVKDVDKRPKKVWEAIRRGDYKGYEKDHLFSYQTREELEQRREQLALATSIQKKIVELQNTLQYIKMTQTNQKYFRDYLRD